MAEEFQPTHNWRRCEGGGTSVQLEWEQTPDYPGAATCPGCGFGVVIDRNSLVGNVGMLRSHQIDKDEPSQDNIKYRTSGQSKRYRAMVARNKEASRNRRLGLETRADQGRA